MSSSAEQNNWLSDLRCYQAIKNSLAGRHDHIAKAYQQQWPNFIIIGSAKSATTTLATVLGRHPEIQISRSMEPKFFGRNYRRGWEWYGQQFSGAKRHRLRGEASTMYTSSYRSYQHSPQLIRHHLGIIPLIYLVRHPLRRIESHWRHWRGRVNDCPPFHQLLESKALKQRVVEASLYHQQLMRYRRCFTVHERFSIRNSATKCLSDTLMPKTNTKKRHLSSECFDDIHRNTCLIRRTWAGGDHNPLWTKRFDLRDLYLIISRNFYINTQLAKILNKIKRK